MNNVANAMTVLILLKSFTTLSFAQNNGVFGYVVDKKNGERLIGANIYFPDHDRGTPRIIMGIFYFNK
ncbi:MAG: carboxypeptidase-like regulatory domain-containing protein [Bacteroidales bacterium]|nr:carboxypeptidase-like regulatory domain-containing protein [Bacteroidales bacterium]